MEMREFASMTDEQIELWNESNEMYWRVVKSRRAAWRWVFVCKVLATVFFLWGLARGVQGDVLSLVINTALAALWWCFNRPRWIQNAKSCDEVLLGLDNLRDEYLLPAWRKP